MDAIQVTKKLNHIFERVNPEKRLLLAKELAKIAPIHANSEVAWQASWVYDFDENIVHGSFLIKINPAQSVKSINLATYFYELTKNQSIFSLEKIEEVCNQLIDYTINDLDMKLSPALYLKDEVGVIHFGLNGEIKDVETVELLRAMAEEKMKNEVIV